MVPCSFSTPWIDDLVGARALDLGAHGDQEIGQIHHLGLARRVLEDRLAVGQRRGHHQVLGARHGDGIEHQARALQAPGPRADVAALDLDLRAHGLQSRDVDVHRPRTDGAAARQRDIRAAEAGHQRTQHQDRGAHGLHQIVRREALAQGRGIDLDAQPLGDGDADAHAAEQLDGGRHILQMRHVADGHRLVGQQARRQDRQRRVLGAGDAHFALERHAARDL